MEQKESEVKTKLTNVFLEYSKRVHMLYAKVIISHNLSADEVIEKEENIKAFNAWAVGMAKIEIDIYNKYKEDYDNSYCQDGFAIFTKYNKQTHTSYTIKGYVPDEHRKEPKFTVKPCTSTEESFFK